MILRNLIKYSKTLAKGQTVLSVGDIITKQTTFSQDSTSILDKISNIARVKNPPRTLPHLQTGAAFSELIGNTLPESIYVKQDFYFKKKVQYGTKVDIRMEIIDIKDKKVQLKTQILDKTGEVLVDGKSLIIYEKLQNQS